MRTHLGTDWGWLVRNALTALGDGWQLASATGVIGSQVSLHPAGQSWLIYMVLAEFHGQQEKDKSQCTSIFSFSACLMFAIILLAKRSPMAKSSIRVGEHSEF